MNSIIEAAQARRAAPVAAAAGPQTLHLMTPQTAARWDAFVRACPEATFFHLSGWQSVIEQSFGIKTWFYFVEQDGQIQGVLPLAEIKSRLFGHSLGAMPFCVYGGVAAIDASTKLIRAEVALDVACLASTGNETAHAATRHIARHNRRKQCHCEPDSRRNENDDQHFRPSHAHSMPWRFARPMMCSNLDQLAFRG